MAKVVKYRWGKPSNSRSFHIFEGDGGISLCGKWMFMGAEQLILDEEIDACKEDCKQCCKVYNNIQERAVRRR